MGWLTGVEPANDGITIRCLNHLTTATMRNCDIALLRGTAQGRGVNYAKTPVKSEAGRELAATPEMGHEKRKQSLIFLPFGRFGMVSSQPAQSRPARTISLYGCGVVSPGAANLSQFLEIVRAGKPVLEPSKELYNAFLVGNPKFNFSVYRDWISERHAPSRFSQLNEKGGSNVQFAVGTTIDALEGNPGLERALKRIDPRVFVCYGSGFGDLNSFFKANNEFSQAAQIWDRFWADPARNTFCQAHMSGTAHDHDAPADPRRFEPDSPERAAAWTHWNKYWAPKCALLQEYLSEFSRIESAVVGADVAADKLNMIRAKAKAKKVLAEKFACPTPPWEAVNANFLWNLPNAPAAQVSMLLGVHGVSYASIAACATFGLVVRQALDAIRSGTHDAAIIGTVDVPPPPELVSGFYAAKVLAAGSEVGVPLCHLRGTHVAGGACTWILAADDVMEKLGVKSLGVEVLGAGLSSDAEHIITPSSEGPKLCIQDAFDQAQVTKSEIDTWDMHATGTPGDWSEFQLINDFVSKNAVITARKGIFGHGMSTCGGWEVTAQVFALTKEGPHFTLPGSGIAAPKIHPSIAALQWRVASDTPVTIDEPKGLVCGKLSMGIGGV